MFSPIGTSMRSPHTSLSLKPCFTCIDVYYFSLVCEIICLLILTYLHILYMNSRYLLSGFSAIHVFQYIVYALLPFTGLSVLLPFL